MTMQILLAWLILLMPGSIWAQYAGYVALPYSSNPNAEWFKQAKWGLFTHFLAEVASAKGPSGIAAEEWSRRVNSFDVHALADQLSKLQVPYYFITLGQNSGYYCSPNRTYDSIVAHTPSRCSQRDLIADLARALSAKGIKLGVYLPSGAPEHDSLAVQKLGWKKGNFRNAGFQQKWEAIIREWSLRWGKDIFAWWIDGVYYADSMYRHPEAPNFASFAAALRAGNPDALISFNSGIKPALEVVSEHEDFTAGELAFSLALSGVQPWNNKPLNLPQNLSGKQMHYLTFLGKWWGQSPPRFPDLLVVGYTQYVNEQGGVITWDVPVSANGTIPPAFISQLKHMRQVRK